MDGFDSTHYLPGLIIDQSRPECTRRFCASPCRDARPDLCYKTSLFPSHEKHGVDRQTFKDLQEILSGMRVIKFFSWEVPFLKRISDYRRNEMAYVNMPSIAQVLVIYPPSRYIRTLLIIKSAMNAVAISLPSLASVIAFVTYSLTGHSLTAANIFTSLTLFNLARLPLMFLRVSFIVICSS